MIEAPAIQFYTRAFFEELATRLNADEGWARRAGGVTAKIICTATDLERSFMLDVRKGRVAARAATREMPAAYKFEGGYDAWAALCKGEAELPHLIEAGRIRFAGSVSDLPVLVGLLNRMVMAARKFPKRF